MSRTKKWVKRVGWFMQFKAHKTERKWYNNYDFFARTKPESIEKFNKHAKSGDAYSYNKSLEIIRCVPLYMEVPDGKE